MNKTWIAIATTTAASALAMLAACANDDETGALPPEERNAPVPAPAADDGGADAQSDASVCVEDCEYYPDECTDDALCANALFGTSATSDGLDLRTHVHALAARSPTDAWLIGTVGVAAHFDGTSWKRSVTDTQHSFYGFWLHGSSEIAFDDPTRLYARGRATDAGAPVSAGGWSFLGTAAVHHAWAGLGGRVSTSWAHPDSTSLWIGVTTQHTRGGLWRMRESDDGQLAFTPATLDKCGAIPCQEVYGISGRSADEVWAVGPRGAAFRITNAEADEPTLTGFNTQTIIALHGVWVAGPNDVWVVGSTGTVRRWRGDPRFFEAYDEVPTKQHLRVIAGSSPSDIWIAGDEGTVFHYDGAEWTRMKVAGLGGRRPRLQHIWIPSPGKVWIAGQGVLVSLGGKP